MTELTQILGLSPIILIPVIWFVMSKMQSEKGLFGKHSCGWLNSCCLRHGKHQVNGDWYCQGHYEEHLMLKEMVDKVYNNEISNEQFAKWRGWK